MKSLRGKPRSIMFLGFNSLLSQQAAGNLNQERLQNKLYVIISPCLHSPVPAPLNACRVVRCSASHASSVYSKGRPIQLEYVCLPNEIFVAFISSGWLTIWFPRRI